MFVSLEGGRAHAQASVALPATRAHSGSSGFVAGAAREGGLHRPHVPSVQAHRRTCIWGGAEVLRAGHAPPGASGPVCGKLGVGSGAVISPPLPGCPGRQHPAEEVIRVLPGAGSRERLGGSAPFPSDINSWSVGGGGEQHTQE